MFSDFSLLLKNKRNLQDGFIKRLGKLQLVHQLHQTEAENKKLTDELTQSKWVNQELAQQLAEMEKENRNLMQLNKQLIEKKTVLISFSRMSKGRSLSNGRLDICRQNRRLFVYVGASCISIGFHRDFYMVVL